MPLRQRDVERALIAGNLPATPIFFFDAKNDEAETIWESLRGQVGRMRGVYVGRALAAAVGVTNLINNVD